MKLFKRFKLKKERKTVPADDGNQSAGKNEVDAPLPHSSSDQSGSQSQGSSADQSGSQSQGSFADQSGSRPQRSSTGQAGSPSQSSLSDQVDSQLQDSSADRASSPSQSACVNQINSQLQSMSTGQMASQPQVLSAHSDERLACEPGAVTTSTDDEPVSEGPGFFARLKAGLKRTSSNFSESIGALLLGKKEIDEELLEELETQLLVADVGIEATQQIIASLTQQVSRKQLADAPALYNALQNELSGLLAGSEKTLQIDNACKPYVILMVGVNGVGKTTTIGKLARRFQDEGKSVMLAAGDTFRAAAVEQLQAWGERNNVPVVAQHTGADSASVIFDALQGAKARNVDVLIADTAGRLHNKDNLMQELKKVVRVMGKLDSNAPHEVMLVLDAGTGQNALSQAAHFKEAVGVSGITLTKLDGTAKGGIIFAISQQLQLPIRFIGVGEQVNDLRPFNAREFVAALFNEQGFND